MELRVGVISVVFPVQYMGDWFARSAGYFCLHNAELRKCSFGTGTVLESKKPFPHLFRIEMLKNFKAEFVRANPEKEWFCGVNRLNLFVLSIFSPLSYVQTEPVSRSLRHP
jgi:hypothetical protein